MEVKLPPLLELRLRLTFEAGAELLYVIYALMVVGVLDKMFSASAVIWMFRVYMSIR